MIDTIFLGEINEENIFRFAIAVLSVGVAVSKFYLHCTKTAA